MATSKEQGWGRKLTAGSSNKREADVERLFADLYSTLEKVRMFACVCACLRADSVGYARHGMMIKDVDVFLDKLPAFCMVQSCTWGGWRMVKFERRMVNFAQHGPCGEHAALAFQWIGLAGFYSRHNGQQGNGKGRKADGQVGKGEKGQEGDG